MFYDGYANNAFLFFKFLIKSVCFNLAQRRSRSRTPSRIATPQVSKVQKAEKKRGRPKIPKIVTSTPNAKSKSKKTPESATKKRKRYVVKTDFEDLTEEEYLVDDVDYPKTKKLKSPTAKKPKSATKKPLNDDGDSVSTTRRSRRIQEQLTSINEESESSKTSKHDTSKKGSPTSANGSIENNSTIETTQSDTWNWFNCAVM